MERRDRRAVAKKISDAVQRITGQEHPSKEMTRALMRVLCGLDQFCEGLFLRQKGEDSLAIRRKIEWDLEGNAIEEEEERGDFLAEEVLNRKLHLAFSHEKLSALLDLLEKLDASSKLGEEEFAELDFDFTSDVDRKPKVIWKEEEEGSTEETSSSLSDSGSEFEMDSSDDSTESSSSSTEEEEEEEERELASLGSSVSSSSSDGEEEEEEGEKRKFDGEICDRIAKKVKYSEL